MSVFGAPPHDLLIGNFSCLPAAENANDRPAFTCAPGYSAQTTLSPFWPIVAGAMSRHSLAL